MLTCPWCGLDVPLVGRSLDRFRRHRKYVRRADGRPVGPALNVCSGSAQQARWRTA